MWALLLISTSGGHVVPSRYVLLLIYREFDRLHVEMRRRRDSQWSRRFKVGKGLLELVILGVYDMSH